MPLREQTCASGRAHLSPAAGTPSPASGHTCVPLSPSGQVPQPLPRRLHKLSETEKAPYHRMFNPNKLPEL